MRTNLHNFTISQTYFVKFIIIDPSFKIKILQFVNF